MYPELLQFLEPHFMTNQIKVQIKYNKFHLRKQAFILLADQTIWEAV